MPRAKASVYYFMKENTVTVLPLIDTFTNPFDVWEQRKATYEEITEEAKRTGRMPSSHVKVRVLQTIRTAVDAAKHLADVGADPGLERHIENELYSTGIYASWRKPMPSATPSSISKYQKSYPDYDVNQVDRDIDAIGVTLQPGQQLFHGGLWPGENYTFTTARPLSTTFCPQVAMQELAHNGKAYDAGRIDLFVLRVIAPATKVFVFRNKGTNLGHEKEVLFASGANLTLRNRTLIRDDYQVCKIAHGASLIYKKVPSYVLEVDIA
jgi:hypothetical protein